MQYAIVNDKGDVISDLSRDEVDKILSGAQQTGGIKTVEEKQLEVFLEHTSKPKNLREFFWTLDHILALIKITNPTERKIWELRVENLVRAYILENHETLSLLDMDSMELYSMLQLSRSITYDGTPNERGQWTMVQSHQTIEHRGDMPDPNKTNALSALKGLVRGRNPIDERYR